MGEDKGVHVQLVQLVREYYVETEEGREGEKGKF